ncbi:MAG: cyclic nucleotide-binding domain-containing protein [Planctomycetota bacterium]
MTTIEKVYFLKGVELFSTLQGQDVLDIALAAEEVEKVANEEIVREGELDETLYVVVSGTVGVYRGNQMVAQLKEGEVFGELALLDPAPRSATVRSVTESTLLRVEREVFLDLVRANHEIAEGITRILARRLRAMMA